MHQLYLVPKTAAALLAFVSLALLLGMATPAVAAAPELEAAAPELEEVIVTSSRVEMPLRQVGTSVSVLSNDDIRQRGLNALADLLRTQPAIGVSNSGGSGQVTTLRVRGEEGYRTRVYIDGIDIADAASPQVGPRIEHVLSAGIDRVEILRGPQGLMYGADAGGVVNITTAPGGPGGGGLGGELHAEGGRYGTQQLGARLGFAGEQVTLALSTADYRTDGFSARTTDAALRDRDGYRNRTHHAKLRWAVNEDLALTAVARQVDGKGEYDGCFTASFEQVDDCDSSYDQSAQRVALDHRRGPLSHTLSYSASDIKREDRARGARSFGGEGRVRRLGYLGSFDGGEGLRLVYGAERLEESFADGGGSNNEGREQDGYYLEYQGGFGDALFVTAGARRDDNADFGKHTSYRASLAYLLDLDLSDLALLDQAHSNQAHSNQVKGELKLKASWGTGFRAPSPFEVAYNRGPAIRPPAADVALREERSDGFDIGAVWSGWRGRRGEADLRVEANYFEQAISNEIYYDPVSFSGYLQDRGKARSKGVELSAEAALPLGLRLAGNYTYNSTRTAADDPRPRRPKRLANVGLRWEGRRLSVGLNLRLVRDATDTDGTALDDHTLLDLNATYDLANRMQLHGRIENLGDERYEEIPTYNTPRRAAYAGLRYRF